jgi:hypothetical protein
MRLFTSTSKMLAFLCLTILAPNLLIAQHNHDHHAHKHNEGVPPHRTCHTMDVMDQNIQTDPAIIQRMQEIERHTQDYINSGQAATDRNVITIPVVVHVLYNNNTENISDAQILSQMQVLNDDFRRQNPDANNKWSQAADTEIEFCLASVDPNGNATSGITRTFTNTSSFSTNDAMKFSSQGGKDAWPTDQYLNMWVCDLGGGILGYAQFPGSGSAATDGVVMGYKYFGTVGAAQAPFDGGRTTTHEVGHWLNLRHIWGDGNCSQDDFINDTPTSDAPNYGCAQGHVSCSSADMVENYMDYSDDACMNLFTAGQKARMRALFSNGGFRASLLSSNGCGGGNAGGGGATACSGTVNSFPYSESFESGLGAWSQSSGDDIDWTRRSGSTPSSNTGPSAANSGSFYLYVEASSPNYPSKVAILNSPCYNFSNLSNPQLTFQYHMYGAAMGTLAIQASNDGGNNWVTVWSRSGDQTNTWSTATVDLAAYAGDNEVRLRVYGLTGNNFTGDMAIDGIAIENASSGGGNTGGGSGTGSCSDNAVSLNIDFDNYASETSWSVVDANGNTVASGSGYTNGDANYSENLCLADGCYDFVINDSYGDGICCSYGNGNYSLTDADGNVLASGGSFSNTESTNFCLGGGSTGGGGTGGGATSCPLIDFNNNPVVSYGGSQDNGTNSLLDANTVVLEGNSWKAINLNYTVTANTVIEFEFGSTTEGEIHGIGFDNDNAISSNRTFRLYGTQNWGIANYDDYASSAGSWKTYVIPVGQFYTGTFDRLFFANDDDANSASNSYFRNIRIYEGSCSSSRSVVENAGVAVIQNQGEAEFELSLYPNPAQAVINVEISTKTQAVPTRIMDATGRTLWFGELNDGINNINIEDLPAGIYHLSAVQADGTMITRKFVKTN